MKKWHWIAMAVLTVISLIVEFTYLADYKSHWWNYVPAFYIIWGFVSCAVIIYVSQWLGKLYIFREEDYYDH